MTDTNAEKQLAELGGAGQAPPLLAVAINNSRTRVGLFAGGSLHKPASAPTDDPGAVAQIAALAIAESPEPCYGAIASVKPSATPAIRSALAGLDTAPESIVTVGGKGEDALPIELTHSVDDGSQVGVDRLLNAIGAFSRAGQACVVIDAGTAVTVDFVDGQGVFHGGAIGAGVGMALRALSRETEALPEVAFEPRAEGADPYGRNTADAMRLGVSAQVRGMAHVLIQEYAEAFGAYPQIVATGGDAPALFQHDDLVEHIVPDLQLIGMHAVYTRALSADA